MYKFIKRKDPDNHFDITDVQITTETENLDDLCEVFEDFLKACGYSMSGRIITIEEGDR